MAAEDIRLVRAWQDGDLRAFGQIVSRYQSLVCAITYSAVGNFAVSEELAQETFVQAWKNAEQLRDADKFRSWLCSIARNIVCNYLRAENRRPVVSCNLEAVPTAENKAQTPLETLIRQEEEEMICHALMQIPEEYRQPLVLFYRQDRSMQAVAEMMGLTESTVRTRLHRGRKMLRQQVESRIETTLKKTAPGPAFTRTVMAAIGTGLAAGLAGTATAAGVATAATGSGSALTAAGGILTTVSAKIAAVVVAASIVLTAGVVFYSHVQSADTTNLAPVQTAGDQSINAEEHAPIPEEGVLAIHPKPEISMDAAADTATAAAAVLQPMPHVNTELKPVLPAVRHSDWPEIDEPVNHIYVETHGVSVADGTAKTQKFWARLPDAFREEGGGFDKITIDNGKQRLVLDPNTMQARLGPTWFVNGKMTWQYKQLLEEHSTIVQAKMFRQPNLVPENIKVTPLTEDSDNQIIIYKIESENLKGIDIKAWVDKRTLLPERITVSEPNQYDNVTGFPLVVFDFAPAADSVFSTDIPFGYQTLPAKQLNAFSGKVVDLLGYPVSQAEVYLYCWTLGSRGPLKGQSDKTGRFTILLPPYENGFSSTIVLWSILPDYPEFIAWTMLLDPYAVDDAQRNPLAGTIPGSYGIVYPSEDYFYKKTDSGTVSRGYWCAGASDIVLVMEPGVQVSGSVQDIYGNPVSGAEISIGVEALADKHGNGFHWARFPKNLIYTQTDTNGKYAVYNVPRLWEKCLFSVAVNPTVQTGLVGDAKRIRINNPNQPIQADFILLPKGPMVRGIVKDNYDIALPERDVYVQVNGKRFPGYLAKTDKDGRFEFVNCPADAGLEVNAELSHNSMAPHENEKFLSYVYYPDVTLKVGYQPEQEKYDLELIAVRPEIEIEAVLADSAGNPLPWFPVEICADESISTQWSIDRNLCRRTDDNGYVKFINVPEMNGLRLVCSYALNPWSDNSQSKEMQDYFRQLEQVYRMYRWTVASVPAVPEQKKYKMKISILTNEEFERQEK